MNKVLVINGPNLNLLGSREDEIYGKDTLKKIQNDCELKGKDLDIEIHIYGVGSLEHEINEYIKKNNKNIKLMGTINNKNLNNELRKYRFFVTSSLFEGNPKSVMEAMAAGCVIFASNISNHQDLITHNKNGFLFELGSDNLNQLFKKHFRSSDYLSEISRNVYDIANEKFELNILSKIEYEDYLSVIKPA